MRGHCFGVGAETSAFKGWRLDVGGEVDVIGVDVVGPEDLRNLIRGTVQEVDSDGDDVGICEDWWRAAGEGVDLVPAGEVRGEDSEHGGAGDAVGASDDYGVFGVVEEVEGGEAVEDAFGVDGLRHDGVVGVR